jgi:hypothetical protein
MQSYDFYAELKHTNNILMELPCFRQLSDDNELLHERIQSLKTTIEYLESKNRRLSSKIVKYKNLYKQSKKVSKKKQFVCDVIDLVSDDDVDIKFEKVIVEQKVDETIVETDQEVEDSQDEEVVEYEIVELVVQEQEKGGQEEGDKILLTMEDAAELSGEEDEEVVEDEEEEESEEVVEDKEEEEVVEAEEEEEVVEAEEEESEVYDIEINGKTYYVQNEKDSPIYEADENGDISMEVGVYKKGIPTFF